MSLRMTFAQYRQSITRTGPPPAKPSQKKAGRKPKYWKLRLPWFTGAVFALTKSEARAKFKEILGGPLPAGSVVEEVEE